MSSIMKSQSNTKHLKQKDYYLVIMIKAKWRIFEESTIKERKKIMNGMTLKKWNSLYKNSFLHSKEWKDFKVGFLKSNTICERCKNKATTPHHKTPVSQTVVKRGFLKDLEDFRKFEPVCKECHFKEHEGLIGIRNIFSDIEKQRRKGIWDSVEKAKTYLKKGYEIIESKGYNYLYYKEDF